MARPDTLKIAGLKKKKKRKEKERKRKILSNKIL